MRRYKDQADIRGDSVPRGPKRLLRWSESAIFRNFGRNIFRTFTVEANIIMRRREVPLLAFIARIIKSDPKMLDLE